MRQAVGSSSALVPGEQARDDDSGAVTRPLGRFQYHPPSKAVSPNHRSRSCVASIPSAEDRFVWTGGGFRKVRLGVRMFVIRALRAIRTRRRAVFGIGKSLCGAAYFQPLSNAPCSCSGFSAPLDAMTCAAAMISPTSLPACRYCPPCEASPF